MVAVDLLLYDFTPMSKKGQVLEAEYHHTMPMVLVNESTVRSVKRNKLLAKSAGQNTLLSSLSFANNFRGFTSVVLRFW